MLHQHAGGKSACLLMKVALVCHQHIQCILKLEKGVEVVVAEQDCQLAGLQSLQPQEQMITATYVLAASTDAAAGSALPSAVTLPCCARSMLSL